MGVLVSPLGGFSGRGGKMMQAFSKREAIKYGWNSTRRYLSELLIVMLVYLGANSLMLILGKIFENIPFVSYNLQIIGFIASGMYTLYGDAAGANAAGVRIINSAHSLVKNMVCDSDIYGVLTGYCNYLTIEHNICKYDGGSTARGQHGIYH